MGGQGEARFGLARVKHKIRDVAPHGGPVLEPMAAATTNQPHIVPGRVTINQQIPVVRILVLADPRFGEWAAGEIGKAVRKIGANIGKRLIRDPAIRMVRIEPRPVGI